MRTLGIDPGYDRLGVAVVEKTNGNETLIYSDCVQTDKTLPFPERLRIVGDAIALAIADYKPNHVAVENVFFSTNRKTAMDVAAVRGLILYIAEKNNCEVFEYTPPQIKVAVAGSGRGTKKDIIAMVHHLVTFNKKKALDDEYDAIAVALTHSAIHR